MKYYIGYSYPVGDHTASKLVICSDEKELEKVREKIKNTAGMEVITFCQIRKAKEII